MAAVSEMVQRLPIFRTVSAHPVGISVAILIISSCTQAIPLEDFYPFGNETFDAQLPPNDDGFAGPVNLPAPLFPFYDELYESIFVSTKNESIIDKFSHVSLAMPDYENHVYMTQFCNFFDELRRRVRSDLAHLPPSPAPRITMLVYIMLAHAHANTNANMTKYIIFLDR